MNKLNFDEGVAELQYRILDRWGATEAELGPLLYELRVAMKKQGSRKGLGFTAWLAKHGIPRTTAIRWADNYAGRIGKNKQKVARKAGKRRNLVPDGTKSEAVEENTAMVQFVLTLTITEAQQNELLAALDVLGAADATQLICDTLRQAAEEKSKVERVQDPSQDEASALPQPCPVQSVKRRLTFLDDDSEVV